jgi:hypothetical protein
MTANRVAYHVKDHESEQLLGGGVADRLFVVHIDDRPDGGVTYMPSAYSRENMPPDEIFKIWAVLAHQLAQALPDGGRRDLCQTVHNVVRDAIMEGRK